VRVDDPFPPPKANRSLMTCPAGTKRRTLMRLERRRQLAEPMFDCVDRGAQGSTFRIRDL